MSRTRRQILIFDTAHFAEFLEERNATRELTVICELMEPVPAPPYIELYGSSGARDAKITLSHGLCAVLIDFMRKNKAQLRDDGALVLGCNRV